MEKEIKNNETALEEENPLLEVTEGAFQLGRRALRLACRSITSFTPTSQWKSPEKLVDEYLESAEMEMKKDGMEENI